MLSISNIKSTGTFFSGLFTRDHLINLILPKQIIYGSSSYYQDTGHGHGYGQRIEESVVQYDQDYYQEQPLEDQQQQYYQTQPSYENQDFVYF